MEDVVGESTSFIEPLAPNKGKLMPSMRSKLFTFYASYFNRFLRLIENDQYFLIATEILFLAVVLQLGKALSIGNGAHCTEKLLLN